MYSIYTYIVNRKRKSLIDRIVNQCGKYIIWCASLSTGPVRGDVWHVFGVRFFESLWGVLWLRGEDPLKILKTSFYPTPKYPLNSFRSQLRWKPETSSNGSTSSHFFPKFYVVLCCFTACACAWVAQQMGQSLALGKAISANEFGFGKLRVFVNVHFPQQRLAQVGRSKKVKFHRFFWRGDFFQKFQETWVSNCPPF